MTFAAPGWILVAAAAALGAVVVHLIAWKEPRPWLLPTARFVPDERARFATRTIRLSDRALLLLRVLMLLAAGLALARPSFPPRRSGLARVIAVDVSGSVRSRGDVMDSLRAIAAGPRTTTLLTFDTVLAHSGSIAAFESRVSDTTSRVVVPSLTTGLLGAVREAHRLAATHERVEIVLVSTFLSASFDGATSAARALWPGPARVIRIAAAPRNPSRPTVDLPDVDNPVGAGLRLAAAHGFVQGAARVIRTTPTPADSAWASAGGVLVVWPRQTSATTVEGVQAGDATAIGHVRRGEMAPDPSSVVVARYADGTPAAHEAALRGGCVRLVGFDVPDEGDFVLAPSFQRLAGSLLAPCAGQSPRLEPAPDSLLSKLASGPPPAGPEGGLAGGPGAPQPLAAWLMGLAVILALAELALRRRTLRGASA